MTDRRPPLVFTGVGLCWHGSVCEKRCWKQVSVEPPIPNCPTLFRPQHCKVPSLKTAQVCESPADILVAVVPATKNQQKITYLRQTKFCNTQYQSQTWNSKESYCCNGLTLNSSLCQSGLLNLSMFWLTFSLSLWSVSDSKFWTLHPSRLVPCTVV